MNNKGISLSQQVLAFHSEKQVMKLSKTAFYNLVFLKAFDTKVLKEIRHYNIFLKTKQNNNQITIIFFPSLLPNILKIQFLILHKQCGLEYIAEKVHCVQSCLLANFSFLHHIVASI